jgi:hypothetical protein
MNALDRINTKGSLDELDAEEEDLNLIVEDYTPWHVRADAWTDFVNKHGLEKALILLIDYARLTHPQLAPGF